jgi:tRNA (guanine-N7-)-methyltransferase
VAERARPADPVFTVAELWGELFPAGGAVEIEIGSGDGTFLLARARRYPDRNFLGIERSPSKAKRIEERLRKLGAPNVRVLQADAACVIATMLPDASVAAYHVYFPDPWPKRGHAGRRIFRPGLVDGLGRTLRTDGRLYLATDVASYASVAHGLVRGHEAFAEVPSDSDHPGLTTAFARKYRAAGRPLYVFTFQRRPDDTEDQILVAASKMRSM